MLSRLAALVGAVALTLIAGASAQAQANPQLVARDYADGRGAEPRPQALRIGRLDIDVSVLGGTARTVITARFDNPTDRALEGDFNLDLPAGSVVNGYALDIAGQMVDGVITPRRQALLAYEARVRQGVDPGIAEITRTNGFRTRVFPIFPRQGRTVRLSFVTPIEPGGSFVLPLNTGGPVDEVVLKVRVAEAQAAAVTAPEGLTLDWRGAEAQAEARGRTLAGALRIGPLRPAAPLVKSRHASGERFIDISGQAEPAAVGSARRVRIYWDRSRSRADDRLDAELGLLSRYLAAVRPETVDLVLFADAGAKTRTIRGDAATVDEALRAVRYTGATSLRGVFTASLPRADACLLFSDGTVTLDAYQAEAPECAVLAVSSAADANAGWLATLAAATGGEHVDLRSADAAAALARLTAPAVRVRQVTDTAGRALAHTSLAAGPGRFRVIAQAPEAGAAIVRFADGRTRTYNAAGEPQRHDGAGALWASSRLAALNATDRPDNTELLRLARRYAVAAPGTAFVVLETASDYAEAEIEPPASLGADARQEYKRLAADRAERRRAERQGRFEEVLDAWEEHKRWWRARYDAKRRPRDEDFPAPPPPAAAPPAAVVAEPVPSPPGQPEVEEAETDEVQGVVVTGSRAPTELRYSQSRLIPDGPRPQDPPRIVVQVAPWNPDRPYLRALADVPAGGFDAALRAQEAAHGNVPAFYFDVAEWLHLRGRTAEARAYVLNVLELPSADTRTLAVLAERLIRYGDFERGVWAHERVLFLEPDRPQPRRNLALALIARAERPNVGSAARRADYQRAVELLAEVALTPWSEAYDGVELIALTEANRVIPRLRGLGGSTDLDPRLIALLDVDLRVTLEWSTDATDMDLWVDEPGGERAYYRNQLTARGGRVSNDMTAGYGPEEYQIRRAPAGRYTIRVDTYRTDQLDPNGAVTIRARLYRNWGRGDEAVQEMNVELRPGEGDDEQLIGHIDVGGPPGRR